MICFYVQYLAADRIFDFLQQFQGKSGLSFIDNNSVIMIILVSKIFSLPKEQKMRKVKVGIVGFGNMGSGHANYMATGEVTNMEVTGICDINPECLKRAKELYPDVPTFDNAEDMYKSGCCEAVIVSTPHYYHPPLSKLAFDYGLHVMCEKPAGVYTKQVLEMNEAAKAHPDRVFTIMFCLRVAPVYKTLKKLIDSGKLGHIKRITWQVTTWYRPQTYHDSAGWRSTWATEGGGTLINQNPHQLDLWQWLFGMPDELWADVSFGKYYDIEVDDDVTCVMRYKNGTTGVYVTSTGEAPGTNRLDISCDWGRVVVENDKIIWDKNEMSEREWNATRHCEEPPCTREEVPVEGEDALHSGILREFADTIMTGAEQTAPGLEGINELTMSNAMYLSTWKGNVWIDLNNFPHDEFYEELQKRVATSKAKKNAPSFSLYNTLGNK